MNGYAHCELCSDCHHECLHLNLRICVIVQMHTDYRHMVERSARNDSISLLYVHLQCPLFLVVCRANEGLINELDR